MIESEPLRYIAAVGGMTLAAYATRIGGYWLIGHVPIGTRLRRMLDALPGAVIAAIVLPILFKGGPAAVLAVVAAIVAMARFRNDFVAVISGIAVAALVRAAGF